MPAGDAEAAADGRRAASTASSWPSSARTGRRPRRRRRRSRPTRPWTAPAPPWSTTSGRRSRTPSAATSGSPASGATVEDYFSAVYDKFPYVLALIALITFVLLVRTFRSLLLPLKAVLLNLISLAAVFGVDRVLLAGGPRVRRGLRRRRPTGAITFWLPVVIFAFLFGLSMDYEVFILARMREEYDRTGDTSTAVVTGHRPHRPAGHLRGADPVLRLRRAGLLARAPTSRCSGPRSGVGILIDATIVRALLVPALVSLFGRWNWWLPGWLARIMLVEPRRSRHAYRLGSIRILSRSGHRSGSARALLRPDDAARDARNPHVALRFIGSRLGHDALRDALPGGFIDLTQGSGHGARHARYFISQYCSGESVTRSTWRSHSPMS